MHSDGFRWSLRFRLMIWNAIVVLITAVVVLIGLREGVRLTLLHEMDRVLQEDLGEIALSIDELQSLHPEELRAVLDRKARSHTLHRWFVQMLNSQGKEVWASENSPGASLAYPVTEDKSPVTIDGVRLVQHVHAVKGEQPLTIRVGTSLDLMARDISRIDRLVLIAVGVVLIAAPLGGYWLAGRATRPLANIIRTTARLRPRQLDERLPIGGTGDELDQLSRTVNGLLDRIASYLEQKRDFLANAAHELRTPLAAIRSSIEVALNSGRSREEYEELLAVLIQECESLEVLVNQLLLLAETDSEPAKLVNERIPVDEVVGKAVDMFSGAAEAAGITLRATALYPAVVLGNRHHLRQVVNNLLDNAIKHTPRGGAINVRLHREPTHRYAVLSVQDSGVGIPPQDLPHIFERFYRGDKLHRRRDVPQGAGLGLSICEAIVVTHGGKIEAQSQLERGTTITALLPLCDNQGSPDISSPDSSSDTASHESTETSTPLEPTPRK